MKLDTTNKVLSLFFAVTLILTACSSKEDDVQPASEESACKLTQRNYRDGKEIDTYTYNSDGYISKITRTRLNGQYITEYYTDFYYDQNDKLIKSEDFENGELDSYTTYVYKNSFLSTINIYTNDKLNYTENIIYDAKKRVAKTEDTKGYVEVFTYNNDDNISLINFSLNGKTLYTMKYEDYDNKLNYLSAIKGYEYSKFKSKNNPRVYTFTFYNNGEAGKSVTYNYTYTYNEENFPIKVVESDGNYDFIRTFDYQCN